MSAIIYEKETNGLYPTGQRSVSTFPSGLIRVDQTFVCKTTAAATHRATLAVGANMPGGSTPAIDGLKIFPEPQEKRRDDGFTEFIVSAYGRVNNTGRTTFEWNTFTATGSFNGITYSGIFRNKTKTVERALLASQVDTLAFDESGATTPTVIEGVAIGGAIWRTGVTSYQSTSFGEFVEVKYTIGAYKLASVGS